MSSKKNIVNDKKTEDKNKEKEKEKSKSKKEKSKIDLFPPLPQEPKGPKINVLIDNKYIFPKVGLIGKESKPYYIGHTKPITRIIYLNKYIFCSISQDSVNIKMWDLNNYNAQCLKNIDVRFITYDILTINENNIVVSGEKLIILNLETEEKIIIYEPQLGNYIEFNLLAKINDNLGVASSLGGYFLLFELNTGKKLRKIEMNKIHFICQLENKEKQIKLVEDPKVKKMTIKKDIGSSKCLETQKGHKGQVYALIGLNSNSYKDCIVSGGFDNIIKIFKTKENDSVINLSGHENTIISLTLSESKDYLFSSSTDFTIRKWNLSKCSCEVCMECNQGIQSLLLPMSNDYLLTAGYDGKIKIWNNDFLKVKSYYYQHGSITTGTLLLGKKELEKNTYIFGDHLGEIFIKQFIIGDDNIKNYNKLKKKKEEKKIIDFRLSSRLDREKEKEKKINDFRLSSRLERTKSRSKSKRGSNVLLENIEENIKKEL